MRHIEECRWEEITRQHQIGAEIFTPLLVTRLRSPETDTSATLTVVIRNVGDEEERQRLFRLIWEVGSVPERPVGVQDRTITEWAACGVACAIVSEYARLHIRSVATEGDRFDYWVDDGETEYGLEVSGTMTESEEDLEARHRLKVRQLLDNPYGVDGYVVVVGFVLRRVIFSFHRFEEVA